MRRAVFLDRDGVINEMVESNEGPDSPRNVAEFRLAARAAEGIRNLNALGMPVVVVSNQPGIAKGKLSAQDLEAMTVFMRSTLGERGAIIDGLYYCLHHPQAVIDDYRTVCECRKPKPGLLTRAAQDMDLVLEGSYMVGDQTRDMAAGKSVGCVTVFVAPVGSVEGPGEADHKCHDLADAASLIAQLETSVAVRY